jgi:hypothetical protein
MEDFTKSYDSLAEAAKEIFEASDYEKKYGGRILQKLAKRKGKLVTKLQWDKADKDQKSAWLGKLPYSNPEEVARYIDVSWKDLPSVIQNNMFESTEELDEKLDKNMSVDEKAYWRVRELIDTLSKKADTLKKVFKKSNKRIPNRLSKDMSVDEVAYWRVVDLIDTLSDTLKKKG